MRQNLPRRPVSMNTMLALLTMLLLPGASLLAQEAQSNTESSIAKEAQAKKMAAEAAAAEAAAAEAKAKAAAALAAAADARVDAATEAVEQEQA